MTNEAMKKVLIKACIFSVVSMTLMLHRSATKHIMITDAADVSIDRELTDDSFNLLIDKNVSSKQKGKLIIPLPKSVGSDHIAIEDNYADHELLVYIDSREEDFYCDTAVKSDLDIIKSAVCLTEGGTGKVCLEFELDGLYANESKLTETGTLEVLFIKPCDEYDRIVLVDPIGGGADNGITSEGISEKRVALDIARELKAIADKDENNNIRFYFTRLSDSYVEYTDRYNFVKDTGADLLIGIGAYAGENAGDFGIRTTYNDSYYIRALNNAQFADLIEKNCIEKSGANAIGMEPALMEDELLMDSTIPSCRVLLGDLNSKEAAGYLSDSTYTGKIAAGIYAGVLEAFDKLETN